MGRGVAGAVRGGPRPKEGFGRGLYFRRRSPVTMAEAGVGCEIESIGAGRVNVRPRGDASRYWLVLMGMR